MGKDTGRLAPKVRAGIAAVLVFAGALVLTSSPANAAGETLTVIVSQLDGAAPFTATDGAGLDTNDHNGIVRTNDNLTYNVELRVNGAASTNTTFRMQLPQGVEITGVPPFCSGSGSSVTPATLPAPPIPVTPTSWTTLPRQTLVCNVGARGANSNLTYPIVAKVRPEVPNGTVLTLDPVQATTTDVPTPVLSTETITATVSARAQYDISKNAMATTENSGYFSSNGIVACATATDPSRRCFQYTVGITVAGPAGGKGLTPMANPMVLTDDLSPTSLYPASVLTDPDWIAAGAGALAKYGAILNGCVRLEYAQPGTKIGLSPQYVPLDQTNSVRDSGTTTCTQPGGPGTPVSISVTGMDSTALTYPTGVTPGGSLPIPADKAYVYSGAIRYMIPIPAVVDLGVANADNTQWSLAWDNKLKDFAPVGIDGVANLPTANATFNDHRGSTSTAGSPGSYNKWFSGVPNAYGNTAPGVFAVGNSVWEGPAGSTGTESGEGQIYAGQATVSTIYLVNGSNIGSARTFLVCDSWDPSLLRLTSKVQPGGADFGSSTTAAMQRRPSAGAPVWLSGIYVNGAYATATSAVPDVGLQVEYGTGNGGAGAASQCNDASSPAGWSTDPNAAIFGNDPTLAAQGVYTGVSRVRFRIVLPASDTGTGTYATMSIGLQSMPGLLAGTILPNWANAKTTAGAPSTSDLLANTAAPWGTNNYTPANNGGAVGDRLRTSPAAARIRKEVKDPATGNYVTTTPQFTGGQTAEFRLNPTLTSSVDLDVRVPTVIEDCIPTGLTFQPASASIAPSVVQAGSPAGAGLTCAAGETYVKWDLGPIRINATIPPITYAVKIRNGAAAGTKVNTVRITAEGDPSAVAQRTSQASIQIVQPAGIVVDKVALTPLIEVNRAGETTKAPVRWQIDFSNIATSPGPTDVDLIDVLPKQGQSGTHFTGALAFDSVTVTDGNLPGRPVEVLYTAAPTVVNEPHDTTNDTATGTTVWCSLSGTTFTRVLGAGTDADCPTSVGAVTGLRLRRPGAFGPSDVISAVVQMTGSANAADDVYVNEVAGRANGLQLLVGPALAPATVVASSIGDYVWNDANLNGVQDAGEAPVAGFQVRLTGTDTDGNPVGPLTTTTDATGHYSFTGLQSGTYTVTFSPSSLQPGQVFTLQNMGANDLVDSDGDPTTGVATVTLGANTQNLTVDQGVFTPNPSISVVKSINGDDANTAPGVIVDPGSTMAVTFLVRNTGNMTLSPVVLTDDTIPAGSISCPNSSLAAGAQMTCTASLPAPAAGVQHTNVAEVVGTPVPLPNGTQLPDVDDDDPANAVGELRAVDVTKSVVGSPVENGDGTTTITYDVVVTNAGNVATTYDLDDVPAFGTGASVVSASVTSAPAGVTPDPTWNGASNTSIATGIALPVGGAHTYRIAIVARVDARSATAASADCTIDDGEATTGFRNEASASANGTTVDADACAPFAAVTMTKSLAGTPVENGDGTTTVAYDVTVRNVGAATGRYDLEDHLAFGTGVTVASASVANTAPGTITTTAGWNGADTTAIVADQAIGAGATHTYRVTVRVRVASTITTAASDCTVDAGEDGTGLLNGATLEVNGVSSADDACAAVPNLSMTKDLVGAPVLEADGTHTLTYDIRVTNSGAGATTYDLADELRFGAGITVTSATVANTAPGDVTVDPAWNGAASSTVATDVAIAGATTDPVVHTYRVTVNARVGGTATHTSVDCTLADGEDGTGFRNDATVTTNGRDLTDDACATPGPTQVTMTKNLVGAPVENGDGTLTATYEIAVSNTGSAPGDYDLTDHFRFGTGVTVADATVTNTAPGTITPAADWDGVAATGIVTGQEIGAGVTHRYRVTATVRVAATITTAASDCTLAAGEAGTGLLNGASLTFENATTSDDACAPVPNLSMTKDLLGPAVDNGDGTHTITYAVTVTNRGAGATTYDLADELRFGAGITVTSATVANTAPGDVAVDPDWDGTDATTVASDVAIAGAATDPVVHTYVVTVTARVGGATTLTDADCTLARGEDGTGFRNDAAVATNGTDLTDDACATPGPTTIVMSKTLIGTTGNGDGTLTATYEIAVANTGGAPGTYDLADQLHVGDGVTVTAATVTNTDPGTITTAADWNGTAVTGIVAGQEIGASQTQRYTVAVTGTVAATITAAASDCTLDAGETGTGLLNGATLTVGDTVTNDDACAAVPNLSITKTVVGEPTVDGDGHHVVTYRIDVTNAGAGATTYDLADDLRFGTGIDVVSATVTNAAPGDVTTNPDWDGTDEPTIATDVPIAGAASAPVVHTYDVVVTAAVTGRATLASTDCTLGDGENGTGFRNEATVTSNGVSNDAADCAQPGPTTVAIAKSVVGAPEADGDGAWTITYDVVVTNTGHSPGTYDLDDQLRFGAGITVDSATIASTDPGDLTVDPAWNGTTATRVATAQELPVDGVHTYRVVAEATAPSSISLTAGDCAVDGDETGTGFRNTAAVTAVDGTHDAEACAAVPSFTVAKTIVGSPTVDGTYLEVTYAITVRNPSSADGTYDVADRLAWGAGIVPGVGHVTAPAGLTADTAWDGVRHTSIATDVPLAAGGEHVWTVTVAGRITDSVTTASGDCTLAAGETGSGLLNTASVQDNAGTAGADACTGIESHQTTTTTGPVTSTTAAGTPTTRPSGGTPTGHTPSTSRAVALPRTGVAIAGLLVAGSAAVTIGAGLVIGVRRRRARLV